MEPEENNLLDLPDFEAVEDETFQPFPPPASPGRDDAGENEPTTDARRDQMGDMPVATRKTVKRNLPKLDAQRLISERGLPALRHVFDKVKFKGKGHEAEDLKTLIRHMEHWAHRLFPKLQFEDFIGRVEQLGNKKEVQTCLKRIRLDLPIVHEDFISNDGDKAESNRLDTTTTDFDALFANPVDREIFTSPANTSLTEEQQQRIEKNKQLALERRQAKLLNNSHSQENDLSVIMPRTQASEKDSTNEAQEKNLNELNEENLEISDGAASTANIDDDLQNSGVDEAI
ncbi:TIMELESS-interacting protein [Trichosurus vulpecula]|uniref:TIMELESS-interacting protein n=1 Tax=Trichosurus vulpecula TaxID=9337 RepID=UPI00186ACE1E|nr:TIMELESS-interacting protein [Trichosurus vulpecula]XP_036591463.1 TIMELESS-interacting protein [Trichosurus vulpecula]XP_036591464.1 TIMELESS-interacting protein [Trichosurus vulpecula]XP_036591465.1 TIMELESS-interacting protein [Trichosurus vulpecula]